MNNDIKRIAEQSLAAAGLHSINIKGKNYTVELLPATQAFAVAIQLSKVFMPAIGAYIDGAKKQSRVLPEDDNLFADAAVHLVSQMENVSVLDIVTLLTSNITLDGAPVNIDTEFRGNLGGLVRLLEFVLKENCGDLFFDYLQAKGINTKSLKDMLATQRVDTSSQSESE